MQHKDPQLMEKIRLYAIRIYRLTQLSGGPR